jgi:hypothetical protein
VISAKPGDLTVPTHTKNPSVIRDDDLSDWAANMADPAAALLRELCQRFFGLPLMVHRDSGADRPFPESDCRWQFEQIQQAQRHHPKSHPFSVDPWNPDHRIGIGRSYPQERASKLIPYVGTPDLTNMAVAP